MADHHQLPQVLHAIYVSYIPWNIKTKCSRKGGSEGSPRKKSEWEGDETPLNLWNYSNSYKASRLEPRMESKEVHGFLFIVDFFSQSCPTSINQNAGGIGTDKANSIKLLRKAFVCERLSHRQYLIEI